MGTTQLDEKARLNHCFEIREQADPQIRQEFEKEFSEKPVTRQYVNEFVPGLIDRILHAATVMKQKLGDQVNVHNSEYHTANGVKRRWKDFPENPPCEPDLSIIVDATQVFNSNGVNTMLSVDSDIFAVQEIANSHFGFSILSMADEYSADMYFHNFSKIVPPLLSKHV